MIKQFGVLCGTESIAQAIELAVHSLEPRNVKVEVENILQECRENISLPFLFMDYWHPSKIEYFECDVGQYPFSASQNYRTLSDYSQELKEEYSEDHQFGVSSKIENYAFCKKEFDQ